MQITLIQTGGLQGRRKKASVEWPLSNQAFDNMLKSLTIESNAEEKKRDSFQYFLHKEGEDRRLINISAIPERYNDLFLALFDALKAAP